MLSCVNPLTIFKKGWGVRFLLAERSRGVMLRVCRSIVGRPTARTLRQAQGDSPLSLAHVTYYTRLKQKSPLNAGLSIILNSEIEIPKSEIKNYPNKVALVASSILNDAAESAASA
jgi:hypothetical protein